MRATASWNTIDTAPRDTALELRIGSDRLSNPIGFPCRLTEHGERITRELLEMHPEYV